MFCKAILAVLKIIKHATVFLSVMPPKDLALFSYISPLNGPTHVPRLRKKFFLLLRYNLFIGVDEMCVKNITVTVSVRVSVTVRVSLV